ncbi:transposase [Hirsutella rhossiliensis]|uniref:Transposase n=1 Tax=Hirsutella rhossiliensis TaxID=111463 RepID=A0A9P8SP86_9HYPO|nr:transposase [Hirsutella rhossiliensis]KAH0968675.1 transposase [Hirsutella rhossiliensis]
MLDTGASDVSTAGLDQFHAWQREDHCATLDTTRAGQTGISFGDGPRIVSTNEVVRDDIRVPAVRKWGHAWFHLARLHRLLRCAGHDDIDEQSIREITRMCHHCQINGTSPQRFRFTLRDDREFNFEITADVVQIGGKPVLHVIDEATAFQGARQVPIEAHNSIGKVEKAHGPLRRAYDILQAELVNDTAGPDGLVPTLLVFGAYPRINHDSPPSPPMIKRAEAIRKAMAALHRAAAARQSFLQSEVLVWREADGWTGPWIVIGNNGHEITINHVNGPRNFRITEVKKYHRDPQALITTPRRLAAKSRRVDPNAPPNPDQDDAPAPVLLPEQRRRGRPKGSKNKPKTGVANLSKKEVNHYDHASDTQEINNLIAQGVFEFIRFDPVAHKGQRLFKARMVREVKGLGPTTRPYEKSRLSKTPLNPESGLHWFVTYYRHHPAGFGMVAMQTDDTLLLASLSSRPQKKERSRRLSSARNQGASYRPRLLEFNDRQPATRTPLCSLAFSTAKLMVFTDGSFANNKDLSSQLGFVIVLANEEQSPADFTIRGNVLHWSSTKSKRVTRSVLASEIYGMVQGFDMAIVIATTLQAIVKQLDLPPTPLIVCTDSYSLYECLVKLGTTKEKRLMIDIMALRQSYEQREMAEIRWINGDDNPADAMTSSTQPCFGTVD